MRVLVTGHKGYIGSVLAPMLAHNGHEVVGLDIDLYKDCIYGDDAFRVDEIIKDIRDAELKDLEDFHAVVHLAGLSNDPLGDLDEAVTDEINHKASVRLASLAKDSGVRKFLFASSCSNYGMSVRETVNEKSDLNPLTSYAKSKIRAEKGISRLAGNGFCPIFMRTATAYGASPRIRFDLVVNNLTAWAFTTGQIQMKSDGISWRPLIHVEDISRAVLAILMADEAKVCDRVFNVGRSAENYRVYELAEIVREVIPHSEIRFLEGAGTDSRSYRVDCNLLPDTLPDFKPIWDVRKGIRQLAESFGQVGLSQYDFEGSKFNRIEHIKMLIRNGRLSPDLRWN